MHVSVTILILASVAKAQFAGRTDVGSNSQMQFGSNNQMQFGSDGRQNYGTGGQFNAGSDSQNFAKTMDSAIPSGYGQNSRFQSAGFGYPNPQTGPPYPEASRSFGSTGSSFGHASRWPESAYVPASPSSMFPQPMMPPRPRAPPPSPPNRQTAEARLAWLEYLANAYIQCDDLQHARKLMREMYLWLIRYPRLRREISESVQVLQQRIDQRKDCHCKDGRCNQRPMRNDNQPREHSLKDMTIAAERNLYKVMGRMHEASTMDLDNRENEALEQVHKSLAVGLVSSAIQAFQKLGSTNPTLVDTKPYGKLDFTLKIIRFDLENPDNCMPLWKSDCQTDFKTKMAILETYDMLRATHPAQKSLLHVFYKIAHLRNRDEITTRLLVAVGRTEAWQRTSGLNLSDRYIAEACLTLHGAPRPDQFNDAAAWEFHVNPLDARAHAKLIYERCLRDRHIANGSSALCQDALAQIASLERSCPFGGFVRIGTFSQVFGDYLFIKCLAPPTPPPSYFLPPRAPPVPHDQYRMRLRRLSRLLNNLTEHLQDVGESSRLGSQDRGKRILGAIRDEIS